MYPRTSPDADFGPSTRSVRQIYSSPLEQWYSAPDFQAIRLAALQSNQKTSQAMIQIAPENKRGAPNKREGKPDAPPFLGWVGDAPVKKRRLTRLPRIPHVFRLRLATERSKNLKVTLSLPLQLISKGRTRMRGRAREKTSRRVPNPPTAFRLRLANPRGQMKTSRFVGPYPEGAPRGFGDCQFPVDTGFL